MNLTAKQFHIILVGALVTLLCGSIAITYYSISYFDSKSEKLVSTKLETEVINANLDIELRHKAELLRNKENIDLLNKIVPNSKDQAIAVAELLNIANDNSLTIGTLTFPASELGAKTTSNNVLETITQTKPVEGLNGILGIELTISQINRKGGEAGAGISYSQLIQMLQAIEKNRRTMQIKNIQIQPIVKSNFVIGYNPTITINLFVKQ